MNRSSKILFTALASVVILSGCNRFDHIGQEPTISPIDNSKATIPESRVEAYPLPMVRAPEPRTGADRAGIFQSETSGQLFRDTRAGHIGDIVTIVINIDDRAALENSTERSRSSDEGLNLPFLLGYEGALNRVLPQAVDNNNLVEMNSGSTSSGDGSIERRENISLRVAAVVTDKMPNGNLVIAGRQEVRVNFELRELRVAGIIRPVDITPSNTITYDKIAEARIVYGGRGHITDMQQPRYGQQVLDAILPF